MGPEGKFDGEFQIGRKANKELTGKKLSYNILSQKFSFIIRTLSLFLIHPPKAGNLRVPDIHAELS